MHKLIWLFGLLLFIKCGSPISSEEKETVLPVTESIPIKEAILAVPSYDYDTAVWTEMSTLIPDAILDLKYATSDNFVKKQMYDCPRCFMRKEAAQALKKASEAFKEEGYRIKFFDCYRPKPIQSMLWEILPDKRYVMPPWKGSMHSKGAAVDLTLVDKDGMDLDMGASFDFFGEIAYHTYKGHPTLIQENRSLLKNTLAEHGFTHIRTEWWHYSYKGKKYALSDWKWPCN